MAKEPDADSFIDWDVESFPDGTRGKLLKGTDTESGNNIYIAFTQDGVKMEVTD